MMKVLIKTLFFFLLLTQIYFAQWYPQNSGTTQHLNKVQFVDANTGWAVGDSGTILHTNNAGAAWIPQASGTNLNLVDISFVNANTGWVLASEWDPNVESILLKTTNGGIDWIQQIQDSLEFSAIFFIDENIGWLVGGGVLKTTDGGNIWIPKTMQGWCFDVQFLDPFTGFVAAGSILKSTDGGDNWIEQLSGFATGSIRGISFSDSENGFAVRATHQGFPFPYLVYRTTNGGTDWLEITTPDTSSYSYNNVYSINSDIVYVVGIRSITDTLKALILRSSDAGTTWDKQLFEINGSLNGVHFVNENIGWVVGDSGTILHTTNGGVTFIDNEPTQPTDFLLSQNYPNPFNPGTTISWQSPVGSQQTLKVFDVLGNEVVTLVDEYKPAGRYEVEFNSEKLSSGVYFYQLRAGEFKSVKKMLLIK